jgi:hypothetical protein
VTNVAGPPVPLYLAGAPLLELSPMMPVMGNLTLVIGVLSYAGQLNLTAVADHDHCPDLEIFTCGVRCALDDLARTACTDLLKGGRDWRWGSSSPGRATLAAHMHSHSLSAAV